MKLFSWNVNGIRAAAKKGFLEWLTQEQPDILCLQETKARKDQVPDELLNDHGYHTFWHSAERAGYSGVATFTKTEPLFVQNGVGIKRFDSEGRVLITEHIYFPNGQRDQERLDYKIDFYAELLKILDEQVASGVNVIVTGDWNTAHKEIDLANPKANFKYSGFLPEERAWIDKYIKHGYVDTFRLFHSEPERYSWWTYRFGARERNVGWRIDYFFVNQDFSDRVIDADIHAEILGSDHCPISLELE